MNLSTYQKLAQRTMALPTHAMEEIGSAAKIADLIHSQLGMSSEVGEFADALKKSLYYVRPLDETNLAEELGDILWYMALAATALGVDLSIVAEANIAKLSARYPEKFGDLGAINRDTEAEHNVLETALSRQEKEVSEKETRRYDDTFFLENENLTSNGNLEIRSGALVLRNAKLIVNGSLSVDGDILLLDSSSVVADDFILSKNGEIDSTGASRIESRTSHIQAHEDIFCGNIMAGTTVHSEKGNIVTAKIVAGFGIQTPNGFLSARNIVINGKETIISLFGEAAK